MFFATVELNEFYNDQVTSRHYSSLARVFASLCVGIYPSLQSMTTSPTVPHRFLGIDLETDSKYDATEQEERIKDLGITPRTEYCLGKQLWSYMCGFYKIKPKHRDEIFKRGTWREVTGGSAWAHRSNGEPQTTTSSRAASLSNSAPAVVEALLCYCGSIYKSYSSIYIY